MRQIALLGGIAVAIATFGSVMRTLVVPRGLSSRLAWIVGRVVGAITRLVAKGPRTYETKDRILAYTAPSYMLVLLLVWLVSFLAGYGLIVYGVGDLDFGESLRHSGSSMLTLGFASSDAPRIVMVHFAAAATGLIVVALQIAYLPVIYASFNRRETLVTMLDTRAGTPAWGPELLARHQLVNITDSLKEYYAEWERWIADVAESHTNYPVLLYLRSPHPRRNWLVGLLAVMDSAAMYQSLAPRSAPSETRLVIRMGFTSLREIARVARIPFDPDPKPNTPIRLTYEDFLVGVERLRVGFPMERSIEEAWANFRGWRVNYEAIAYALADEIDAVPAMWSGPRTRILEEQMLPFRPRDRRPEDPEGLRPNG